MIYAVIDTNVLISAFFTSNDESPTVKIIDHIISENITPVYSDEILSEYLNVLSRKKFNFSPSEISYAIRIMNEKGIKIDAPHIEIDLPDYDDVIFYEIALESNRKNKTYLVTGNIKHFPKEHIVVTPREMMEIISEQL